MSSHLLDFLSAASPPELVEALQLCGWNALAGGNERRSFWEAPSRRASLILPLSRDLADYDLRLSDVGDALVAEYGSSRSALLELLAIDYDVLRMRAGQAADLSGTIPFEDGVKFIAGVRNMLRAAARATTGRQPYFRNRGAGRAERFVDEVRLGQTDRGSYVFTLLSPLAFGRGDVTDPAHQLDLNMEDTSGRAITKTLVRALTAAREASESYLRRPNFGVFMEAVSEGVSAELCHALVEVLEPGSQDAVTIGMNWAKRVPASPVEPIVFPRSLLPPLEFADRRLRETEPVRRARVRGVIKQMTKENVVEGSPFVVSIRVVDGVEASTIRARFEWEAFHDAVAAFDNNDLVTVTGDIEREGNHFWLYNPSQLRAAGQEGPHPDQGDLLE